MYILSVCVGSMIHREYRCKRTAYKNILWAMLILHTEYVYIWYIRYMYMYTHTESIYIYCIYNILYIHCISTAKVRLHSLCTHSFYILYIQQIILYTHRVVYENFLFSLCVCKKLPHTEQHKIYSPHHPTPARSTRGSIYTSIQYFCLIIIIFLFESNEHHFTEIHTYK